MDIIIELSLLSPIYVVTFKPLNLNKLKRLYNYPSIITEKIRNQFRKDLFFDIRVIEIEYLQKLDMMTAANELQSRQYKCLHNLANIIKQKSQIICAKHSELGKELNAYEILEENVLLPSRVYKKSPFKKALKFKQKELKNKVSELNFTKFTYSPLNVSKTPFNMSNETILSAKGWFNPNKEERSQILTKLVHKDSLYMYK